MPIPVELNSSVIGHGPDVILLHGLFAMGKNLAMIARPLSQSFTVHSLDLRNHGRSPHTDTISFAEMADDVIAYMDTHNISQANVLGHSLGGKVAMQMALDNPERVNKLIVADIAPVAYQGDHNEVFYGLNAVDLGALSSRGQAKDMLAEHIKDESVCSFILTNLYRNEQGKYEWLLNVPALYKNYDKLRAAVDGGKGFNNPVLFIKGELSKYIQEQHQPTIKRLFPNASLKVLQGTGHWLHAEKPSAFNRLVDKFFTS